MKLLFDNNLSINFPRSVVSIFPESKHVSELGVELFSDRQLFEFAGKNNYTIVSKDKDFYHLLNTLGPPPEIVWLSIGNCSNKTAIAIFTKHQKQIAEFIKSSRSLFVIN